MDSSYQKFSTEKLCLLPSNSCEPHGYLRIWLVIIDHYPQVYLESPMRETEIKFCLLEYENDRLSRKLTYTIKFIFCYLVTNSHLG